jgi:hypothetical protein
VLTNDTFFFRDSLSHVVGPFSPLQAWENLGPWRVRSIVSKGGGVGLLHRLRSTFLGIY